MGGGSGCPAQPCRAAALSLGLVRTPRSVAFARRERGSTRNGASPAAARPCGHTGEALASLISMRHTAVGMGHLLLTHTHTPPAAA